MRLREPLALLCSCPMHKASCVRMSRALACPRAAAVVWLQCCDCPVRAIDPCSKRDACTLWQANALCMQCCVSSRRKWCVCASSAHVHVHVMSLHALRAVVSLLRCASAVRRCTCKAHVINADSNQTSCKSRVPLLCATPCPLLSVPFTSTSALTPRVQRP